ncbi:MAG: TetR/AcrR family transcriptional regulator [Anaerolineae bacterium]|nr:TetR/AcrR family transcriptional regulator [Anaerolineae bacterium]
MPADTGRERRQRRGERRREEILVAAARVFAAKGYHNATTREIAEAADLAEGTIFNYFPSKRDLLVAIFERGADRMLGAALQYDASLPPAEALADRLATVLGFYARNRVYIRAIVAEAWTDPQLLEAYALPRLQRVAAALTEFLRGQVAAGNLRPFDCQLGAQLLMGMVAALVLPIIRGTQEPPGAVERRRLAAEVVDLFLRGVGPSAEG